MLWSSLVNLPVKTIDKLITMHEQKKNGRIMRVVELRVESRELRVAS